MTDRQPKSMCVMYDICAIENDELGQSDSLSFKNWNKETKKNEPMATGVEMVCAVI